MKKVLVFRNQLHDIVEAGEEFPVHPDMVWMDLANGVSGDTHELDGGVFTLKSVQASLHPTLLLPAGQIPVVTL